MLKISKEVYKQIAVAIVNRWIQSDKDHEKVMQLLFNETDPDRAIERLIQDFTDDKFGAYFLGEMVFAMTPEIKRQLKAEYSEWLNQRHIEMTGKSVDEWKLVEAFSP